MAIETKGGSFIDVKSNDKAGHINIYDKDPRGQHDVSIHVNANYEDGTVSVTEKIDGETTQTPLGGCYLTTACMKHLEDKFDDNCEELTVLRWFRDKFVSKDDIKHYYEVAPIIVNNINALDNNGDIYNLIYKNVVLPCVIDIQNMNYASAYDRYKKSILLLEQEFIIISFEQKVKRLMKTKKNCYI